jgi:hypothetical protein
MAVKPLRSTVPHFSRFILFTLFLPFLLIGTNAPASALSVNPAGANALAATGLTPSYGLVGDQISIVGSGFNDVTSVKFPSETDTEWIDAAFTIGADSQLLVTVPAGVVQGQIKVVTGAGFVMTPIFVMTPRIDFFTIGRSGAFDYIEVHGVNLSWITNGFAFTIGTTDIRRSTYLWTYSPKKLTVRIPDSANVSGTIQVANEYFYGASARIYTQAPTAMKLRDSTSNFQYFNEGGVESVGASKGFIETNPVIQVNGVTAKNRGRYPGLNSVVVEIPTGVGTVGTSPRTFTWMTSRGSTSMTSYVFKTPTITSFTPTSGGAGTIITINGDGFTSSGGNRPQVVVGGTTLSVNSASQTQIIAEVPSNSSLSNSYAITVTPKYMGSLASINSVTSTELFHAPPKINSYSPTTGAPGVQVTIGNFTPAGISAVKFNGVSAPFTYSGTNIVATIPESATTGKLSIHSLGGMALTASDFVVKPTPIITSIVRDSGANTVTINGSNFGSSSGTVKAQIISGGGESTANMITNSWSDTSIVARIPGSLTSTYLTVITVEGGIAKSSGLLYAAPTVDSCPILRGPVGTKLQIAGMSLRGITEVTFGGVQATQFDASEYNVVKVTVPAGAQSGTLLVKNPAGQSACPNTYTVGQSLPVLNANSFNNGNDPFISQSLSGSGLTFLSNVRIGLVDVPFTVVNDQVITLQFPSNLVSESITVTSPSGSFTSLSRFVMKPRIDSLTATTSPRIGGKTFKILGYGFSPDNVVKIGTVTVTPASMAPTEITIVTPPFVSNGPYDISVTNTLNQSSTLAAAFTFQDPPRIYSITDNAAPTPQNGNTLFLSGSNFFPGIRASVGGVAAFVTYYSDELISVVPATQIDGYQDLILTNYDSQTTRSKGAVLKQFASLTPTFGTYTATSGGFTVQVSNYDDAYSWGVTKSVTAGSVSISNTGLVTVTGLGFNVSSTLTVTTTRTAYISGSALSSSYVSTKGPALVPAFNTATATSNGFTIQISNYNSAYVWTGTNSQSGNVTISNTGLVTVSGLGMSVASTVTVRTTRTNYDSATATSSSVTSLAASADSTLRVFTINGTSVLGLTSLVVPFGTTSVPIVATANSGDATVQITGGTGLTTGDNQVSVLVTAQNASTTTYTVTVTVAASSDKTLSEFKINNISVLSGNETVTVAHGIDSVTVVATPTSNLATRVISGATGLSTGNNTVQVVVTAADGTTRTYSAGVVVSASSDTALVALTVGGVEITSNNQEIPLPNGTQSVSVSATPRSNLASVEVRGNSTLTVGRNTIQVVVRAASGLTDTNTVYALVIPSSDTSLTSFNIETVSVLSENVPWIYPLGTTSVAASAVANNAGATVTITGNTNMTGGNNTVRARVVAEDGTTTQDYVTIVKVTSPAQPSTPSTPAPSVGGGGGGGGVGTTWFNLFLSSPTNPAQAYPGDACAIFIHRLTEGDKQYGPICATKAGSLDFEANDGDYLIRTFDKAFPKFIKEYKAKVTFGTFEVVGAGYRGGSVPRRVITVLAESEYPATPVATPTPTASPSVTPTPTASPRPTAEPTPTASPSAAPSTTLAPSTIPANKYFLSAPANKSTVKVSAKGSFSTVKQSISKSFQILLPTTTKSVAANISVISPDGKSITILSRKTVANKATAAPAIKFSKAGTYIITIREGSTVKTVRVVVK